ncbi:MAG: thioredoxin family protein [Chthoniobacterales bacterium]
MALTTSEALVPGIHIPGFALPDVVTGQTVTPATCSGAKALVIIFLCRHCPYVVHVMPEVVRLAGDYLPRDIAFLGISANDAAAYPDDSPANLAKMVAGQHIPFPILFDQSQSTARAFHAVCTPEFFVFDATRGLYYHGRLDGSTPGNNIPSDGSDLRHALDTLLAGTPAPAPQHPSMGCNIKWK